jgi:diguanylate cyclase (GGDEF)-like protein
MTNGPSPADTTAAGDPPADLLSIRLRERRLRQITGATFVALLASMAPDLVPPNGPNLAVLGAALALLCGVMVLSWRGRHALAAVVLLTSMQVVLSAMAWKNGGLHDAAVLAYPGLLIFAAMLGSKRLFLGILTAMLLFVTLMFVAHQQGWHVTPPVVVKGSTLVDAIAVLVVIGMSAWLMASDQRRANAELAEQNRRVSLLQSQTAHIATHDLLTGLPNRMLARDRFDQAVAEARRARRRIALLYLDLDNFKNVNDSLGHAYGDALLKVVGERLREMLRGADTVCRLGGDEFLLLVTDPQDNDAVATIAAKVVDQLVLPISLQGVEVMTGCSVGIALYPDDGVDFDSLLKTADMAMYRAKEAGRNGYRFYDAEMNASVVEHVHLVSSRRCARRWRATSSGSPTSRSTRSTPARSSAPRRCCAGAIPCSASCRRAASSRWPSAPGSSARSAIGCCRRPAARPRRGASRAGSASSFPSMSRRCSSGGAKSSARWRARSSARACPARTSSSSSPNRC